MDPRLSPLLCQPLSWYQALSRILMVKYGDHCRTFMTPDGNVQHIVVLHPRYVEAFMMLSIDLHSSRGVSFFLQYIILYFPTVIPYVSDYFT
jgi:hypothetical protein